MTDSRATVPLWGDVDELRVVTSATWLARDLAAAAIVPVVADLGLDVPARTDRTAWWCAGMFAARLAATGIRVPFTGPPASWQASLPGDVLGRDVVALTLAELDSGRWDLDRAAFAKPADVKVPAVPAQWWATLRTFRDAAAGARLPGSTPVLVCRQRVEFAREYRCFVVDGRLVAVSVYRDGLDTWDAWGPGQAPPTGHAAGFADQVLRLLGDQPPAWVLDVGQTVEGRWMVVEANPAWCANPYHADPAGVVTAVLASQQAGVDRRWLWQPGQGLAAWARPLPVRT